MLIQTSTIIGLPIAAIDSESKIGQVENIVIDPESGELAGFIVKPHQLFSKNKILSIFDVIDIDKNGLVVKSEENLLNLSEIVKIERIIKKNIKIIGQRAVTESNKHLGRVSDLLIDTESSFVVKYYLHGILEDRIISNDKMIKITKKALIFSDDVIMQSAAPETEGAAA